MWFLNFDENFTILPEENEVNDSRETKISWCEFCVSLFLLLTIYYKYLLLLVYFGFEV